METPQAIERMEGKSSAASEGGLGACPHKIKIIGLNVDQGIDRVIGYAGSWIPGKTLARMRSRDTNDRY